MTRALAVSGRDQKPAVHQLPVADPGPGQVRVAVEAASINGFDSFVGAGMAWDMLPHTFPVVLGRDFAGTVDAVGDGVTRLAPGDRVAGTITGMSLATGAIADQVTVDAGILAVRPADVTSEQAAAVGLAGITAKDAVDALALTADDVVLVAGATGGVGVFAVQLAAATGATVLATARPGEASDTVRDLGAARAIDYTGDDLAAAIRAAAPEGVTAAIHLAGDPAEIGAAVRPGGRLASATGGNAESVGRDDITVLPIMAASTLEKAESLLAAVADGSLRVPIARTYPFEDAAQALADFGSPKLGKLVVKA